MYIGIVELEIGVFLFYIFWSFKMFLSIEVIVKIVFEFGCDVNDIGFIEV